MTAQTLGEQMQSDPVISLRFAPRALSQGPGGTAAPSCLFRRRSSFVRGQDKGKRHQSVTQLTSVHVHRKIRSAYVWPVECFAFHFACGHVYTCVCTLVCLEEIYLVCSLFSYTEGEQTARKVFCVFLPSALCLLLSVLGGAQCGSSWLGLGYKRTGCFLLSCFSAVFHSTPVLPPRLCGPSAIFLFSCFSRPNGI